LKTHFYVASSADWWIHYTLLYGLPFRTYWFFCTYCHVVFTVMFINEH
jgi:hypothetical protein